MKKYVLASILSLAAASANGEDQFKPSDPTRLTEAQVQDYTGNKPQPPALKDAKIQVQLKDGKTTYDFSANEYKVVTRESSRRVQALIDRLRKMLADCEAKNKAVDAEATCNAKLADLEKRLTDAASENEQLKTRVTELEATQAKSHRITFHVGMGPDGVNAERNDDGTLVKPKQAPVAGLGYQYLFSEQYSLGVTGLIGVSKESKTFIGTANIGYDF